MGSLVDPVARGRERHRPICDDSRQSIRQITVDGADSDRPARLSLYHRCCVTCPFAPAVGDDVCVCVCVCVYICVYVRASPPTTDAGVGREMHLFASICGHLCVSYFAAYILRRVFLNEHSEFNVFLSPQAFLRPNQFRRRTPFVPRARKFPRLIIGASFLKLTCPKSTDVQLFEYS